MKRILILGAAVAVVAAQAFAGGLSPPVETNTVPDPQPAPSVQADVTVYGGLSYSSTELTDAITSIIPDDNCESAANYTRKEPCVPTSTEVTENVTENDETFGLVAGARVSLGFAMAGAEVNATENLTTVEPQLGVNLAGFTAYAYRAYDIEEFDDYSDGVGIDYALADGLMIGAKGNEDDIAVRLLFSF